MTKDIAVKGYPPYPRIINYFRLRPETLWVGISFVCILAAVRFVQWTEKPKQDDFVDLRRFEMVEIEIPTPKTSVPEIVTEEEAEEDIVEEKPKEEKKKKDDFSFGDNSGQYDISALAATPPKPKIKMNISYPKSMRKAGVEGTVVVEIGVSEKGEIVYGRIIKKVHPVLDKLVITMVRGMSFYPAMDGTGKAFACKIFMPIRFKLED